MDLAYMGYSEKEKLAKNPTTPDNILRKLATEEYDIRAKVAGIILIPPKMYYEI